jgi:hypothetical protein
MWIFTPDGFLSIVADKDDSREGRLMVRARNRKHLDALLPECEPFCKSPSDYPWRCWASRQTVAELLVRATWTTTYTNFKGAVADPQHHDALLDVWTAIARYEEDLAETNGRKAGRNWRRT